MNVGLILSSVFLQETFSQSETESDTEPIIAIPQSSSVSPPEITAANLADPSGWILAFGVLAAARLGRTSAQEARLDVRLLQQEREANRAFSKDLRLKRENWIVQEAERKVLEDAKRLVFNPFDTYSLWPCIF